MIAGKVLDEDGDPAGHHGASAQRAAHARQAKLRPTGGASTNDLGEFRIANLRPGKYYLYAQQQPYANREMPTLAGPGKPDMRPIRTFYPEAVTRATATPIEINAGQGLRILKIKQCSSNPIAE